MQQTSDPHDTSTSTAKNPYSPPPCASVGMVPAAEPRPLTFGAKAFSISLWLLGGGLPVAVAVAFYDVESITMSGPGLAVLAALLAMVSVTQKSLGGVVCGLSLIAFCVGVFAWIYFNHWSPRQAQQPVSWACLVFATIYLTALVAVWQHRRKRPV
ncbi:MAG: hypothetical protein ACO1RT_15725 [Planctomycetaceae bacterium]